METMTIDTEINEKDTTKQRLIKATQSLLAKYGYEVATTRLIAKKANVSLSAINFHFETKEKLVHEAVTEAAEELKKSYTEYTEEMDSFLEDPKIDKDRAWEYVDRVISETMHRTFNPKISMVNIGLVEHENGFPESCKGIISNVAVVHNEKILAQLIEYLMDDKDLLKAGVIARSITAAIMSYMEKPILNREMKRELGADMEDKDRVEAYMHDYFMESIRASI